MDITTGLCLVGAAIAMLITKAGDDKLKEVRRNLEESGAMDNPFVRAEVGFHTVMGWLLWAAILAGLVKVLTVGA